MIRTSVLTGLAIALLAGCARHKGIVPGSQTPGVPPVFETRIVIPTDMTFHSDQAVADLNNDGQTDLAVVGFFGELQILLGQGPIFTPVPPLQLGGMIIWIDQGDFDGDGDIDLVLLRKDVQEVNVLFNDGNAQFTPGPTFLIGPNSLQVLAVDADVDGDLDLLVSRPLSPEILVFDGDGSGGFAPGQSITLPGGGQSYTMAVGDPTGDGRPDLVIADPSLERVLIFPGSAVTLDFEPAPTELSVPGVPAACAIGDVTGDGVDDIAVSAHLANQFVVITSFVQVSGPSTYTSIDVPVEGKASLSTIGDVTGDGLDDLVACVIDRASIVVVPQLAGGGLGAPFQMDSTGLPLRPTVTDVDHDGHNDLLVLGGLGDSVNLWLARGDGRLVGARNYDSGLVDASHVVVTDLDGDGQVEVIVGDPHATRLSVMATTSDLRLGAPQLVELGAPCYHIRAADLDRDGRDDLIVPVPAGVKVVHNRSTPGNIELQVMPDVTSTFGSGIGPFGATAVDIDRDGRIDLAIADFDNGNLQIVHGGNDPFDFSGAPQLIPIGGGPIDVAAGDFDGDGILDLAVSRSGLSDILLLRNDGAGNLTQLLSLPVGQAPNFLLTADYDGDGSTDLAVANGDDNTVTVLFAGAAGFTAQSYPAGEFPSSLLSGDMTGDGRPDILVAARLGEDFRVLVNDGAGGFANAFPFPGTLGASGVALADIDRDGDLDLVIASTITNRVSVVNSLQTLVTNL